MIPFLDKVNCKRLKKLGQEVFLLLSKIPRIIKKPIAKTSPITSTFSSNSFVKVDVFLADFFFGLSGDFGEASIFLETATFEEVGGIGVMVNGTSLIGAGGLGIGKGVTSGFSKLTGLEVLSFLSN